ncbi:MAG TPA: lysophospholipid acyltransferase family protein [Acidimicrobiales bacterium]|nr:lysophospholipid acyltransferase family protein [Acidimicrobiales bacterium]
MTALKLPRVRPRFPLGAPTWPGAVPRPPAERTTGVNFDTEWARSYPARLARVLYVEGVSRPLMQVLASPDVDGLDRLEALPAPAIFAANHSSHVDTPLMLTSLPERFRHRTVVAAGADYFFDKRWKGALWALSINAIPVERVRVSPQSTKLAVSLIEDGWSLVIFPEGGRTPDGWGQSHRAGAAYLALRTKAPVVPVHLFGTRRILKKGAKGLPRPARTEVTFGSPLRAAEGESAHALAARIETAIAVLADERSAGYWEARRRAAAGATPVLTGPAAAGWRRAWALDENRRRTGTTRRWPPGF